MSTLFDVEEYFDFESMIVRENKFDNLAFEGVAVMSALVHECYSQPRPEKRTGPYWCPINGGDNMNRFLCNHLDYTHKIVAWFKDNRDAYWKWFHEDDHGNSIREEVKKHLRS